MSVIICIALTAALTLVAWASIGLAKRLASSKKQEEEKRAREMAARLREAVAAGTHLPNGRRICRLPACQLLATHPRFRIVRDDGIWDWVRRSFGAPLRYRVRVDWMAPELAYCDTHAQLAREELNLFLADHERRRQEFIRDFEINAGDFERVGLDTAIAAHLSDREREQHGTKRRSRANIDGAVVQLQPRTGTGPTK